MSIGVDDPRTTPKLSLSRLPCKPKQQQTQTLTPPLHPHLSIPFQWEEAPGKPRYAPSAIKTSAASCLDLDLPPGLMLHHHHHAQFTIMSSSPGMPYTCTFSFRRGPRMGGCGGSRRWRWRRSFKADKANFDLSQTLGDFFMSERKNAKNKMGRLFDFSAINSNLLDIYARFKQAIPWRRRRRNSMQHDAVY